MKNEKEKKKKKKKKCCLLHSVWVKINGDTVLDKFPAIFTRETTFVIFLGANSFLLDPFSEGKQNQLTELPPLKGYHLSLNHCRLNEFIHTISILGRSGYEI